MPPSMRKQTTNMSIPVSKIAEVEKILGRKIASNQTPRISVRVPNDLVEQIRQQIMENHNGND